jgi:hypothetical protein
MHVPLTFLMDEDMRKRKLIENLENIPIIQKNMGVYKIGYTNLLGCLAGKRILGLRDWVELCRILRVSFASVVAESRSYRRDKQT